MTPPATRLFGTDVALATVTLDEGRKTVRIDNLLVDEPELYDYLHLAPASEHTGLISRALRIGAVALRDAATAAKVDYVRKEFGGMREAFHALVTGHFGPSGDFTKLLKETFGDDGELETKLERFLAPGGEFGKVLDEFLGEEGTLNVLLGESGEFQKRLDQFFGDKGLLRQQLDTTFGSKGGQLYELLNPKNDAGPIGSFMAELRRMFDPDVEGSPLHQIRLEMRQQHKELLVLLGLDAGRKEEAQRGTAKGGDHEDWVNAHVEKLLHFGDAAEAVGDARGATRKTGDTLVTLSPDDTGGVDMRIVVEAKNRDVHLRGSKTIQQELDRGMANREAQFAIAVVHRDHAKDEFTPFRYYAPNKIVCVADEQTGSLTLQVAYSLARTLLLTRQGSAGTALDHATVEAVVEKLMADLTKFSTIYGQITNIQGGLDTIRTALKGIRDSMEAELYGLLEKSRGRPV
ncbi:MAG TPA: hypothetical protein VM327_02880 [Candidatus Thermoplasmatota archaeon]|nr:hypothetical protein [Candidatus Thermoplasmatota archaeon]